MKDLEKMTNKELQAFIAKAQQILAKREAESFKEIDAVLERHKAQFGDLNPYRYMQIMKEMKK